MVTASTVRAQLAYRMVTFNATTVPSVVEASVPEVSVIRAFQRTNPVWVMRHAVADTAKKLEIASRAPVFGRPA